MDYFIECFQGYEERWADVGSSFATRSSQPHYRCQVLRKMYHSTGLYLALKNNFQKDFFEYMVLRIGCEYSDSCLWGVNLWGIFRVNALGRQPQTPLFSPNCDLSFLWKQNQDLSLHPRNWLQISNSDIGYLQILRLNAPWFTIHFALYICI